MLTGVPVSIRWVVSLFSHRVTQTKAAVFRGGEAEDAGTLQHLIRPAQIVFFIVLGVFGGKHLRLHQPKKIKPRAQADSCDTRQLRSVRLSLIPLFQFHHHQGVQIEICQHLSWGQISTWDEHRWADPSKTSLLLQVKPPPPSIHLLPCWCHLTAE